MTRTPWLDLPIRNAIMAGRWTPPPMPEVAPTHFRRVVRDKLARAVNVRIDNVTHFIFEVSDQERWTADDFPNQAPPFPLMWMESVVPETINSTDPRPDMAKMLEENRAALGDYSRFSTGVLYEALPVDPDDSALTGYRWVISMSLFDRIDDRVSGPETYLMYRVKADGSTTTEDAKVLVDPHYVARMKRIAEIEYGPLTEDDIREIAVNAVSPSFFAPELAISFMHCRNVESTEVHPTRQRRRALEARNQPVVSYHVLDINPMKRTLATEGQSATVGTKKALHICRGHFATYSADRPLFGRLVGTFWKPNHVRGRAESGTAFKDYRVVRE